MKILYHYPPTFPSIILRSYKLFLKTFPTKMKPTKCPVREKKLRQEKQKRGEERTRKPENSDQKTTQLASKRVFQQNLNKDSGQVHTISMDG